MTDGVEPPAPGDGRPAPDGGGPPGDEAETPAPESSTADDLDLGLEPADDALVVGDEPSPGSTRTRNLIIGGAVAVVVLVAIVAAVLLAPDGTSGYDDDVEANFLAACTADGGDDVAPVCECLYAAIVDTIPYDRFEEVNDALVAEQADADADDAGVRLPDDIDELRVECVEEEGEVVEVDTDTTDGDDATTTTAPGGATTTAPAPESPIITSDAPNAAVPGGVRPTTPVRPPSQPRRGGGPSPEPPVPGGNDTPPETVPPDTVPPDTAPPASQP